MAQISTQTVQPTTTASPPGDQHVGVSTAIFTGIVLASVVLAAFVGRGIASAWGARIASWMSGLWHRSPWRRELAIRHYLEQLQTQLQVVRVPFRLDNPLVVRDIYVPIQAARGLLVDRELASAAVAQRERLVVVGGPGAGKTLLLRHLAMTAPLAFEPVGISHRPPHRAFDWSRWWLQRVRQRVGREARRSWRFVALRMLRKSVPARSYGERPVVPILLLLREYAKGERSVIGSLHEALADAGCPQPERLVQTLLGHGRILLLLDGLDEVPIAKRQQVVDDINRFLDRYANCRMVMTCRTAVYKNGEINANATYRLLPFDRDEIARFLYSWRAQFQPNTTPETILERLTAHPRMLVLAGNPLILTIIAHLYSVVPDFTLPRSRAHFYKVACGVLIHQWQPRQFQFDVNDRTEMLSTIALWNQQRRETSEGEAGLFRLAEGLAAANATLASLGRSAADGRAIFDEIVQRSGLLLKVNEDDSIFQFAHLSIQEYFSALAHGQDEAPLLSAYARFPDIWREPVRLYAGLIEDATAFVSAVRELDPIAALECVADAEAVRVDVVHETIDDCLRLRLDTAQQERVTQAMCILAAQEGRGDYALEKLAEGLGVSPGEGDGPVAGHALALDALIRTASSRAADVIVRRLASEVEKSQALTRMGDVAIGSVVPNCKLGQEWAFHVLLDIRSAQAVEALVTLLDHRHLNVRVIAACALGELIADAQFDWKRVVVSEPGERALARGLDMRWIWGPFESPDETRGRVAGAVAATLNGASAMPRTFEIDPRILLPLCAVETAPLAQLPKTREGRAQLMEALIAILTLSGQPFLRRTPSAERLYEAMDALPDLTSRSVPFHLLENLAKAATEGARPTHGAWCELVSLLPDRLGGELVLRLYRHIGNQRRLGRPANTPIAKADWLGYQSAAEFNFARSVHFFVVMLIAAGVTVFAAVQAADVALDRGNDPRLSALAWFGLAVMLIAWLALLLYRPQPRTLPAQLYELMLAPLHIPVAIAREAASASLNGTRLSLLGLCCTVAEFCFAPVVLGASYVGLSRAQGPMTGAFYGLAALAAAVAWRNGMQHQRRADNPLRNITIARDAVG